MKLPYRERVLARLDEIRLSSQSLDTLVSEMLSDLSTLRTVVDAARVSVVRHRARVCGEKDCSLCDLGAVLDVLDKSERVR